MVGPLGGNDRDPGASTTYLEDVNGGPKGGDDRGMGVLTIYLEDLDGGPPRRQCRRHGSAQHQSWRR
jgi:hypothetical protein